MGTTRAPSPPNSIAPTGTKRTPRIPDLRFRVLVIGRANAGKTSILQRVCDTTESPMIYREGEEVRSTNFVYKYDLTADQVKLNPSMDVSDINIPLCLPLNAVSARRAHHRR
jgi:GTPase SAR1 family protein